MTSYRLDKGGLIDRSTALRFTFDGALHIGHTGDTLASALMANGVTLMGRSFKYHRPRGVLAAGALRCVGGQMQARLILDTQAKIERARGMGILDPKRKYDMAELAKDDVIVSATGVTDGALMSGVRFHRDVIETETVVYRSTTGTVRRIHGEHRELSKFILD